MRLSPIFIPWTTLLSNKFRRKASFPHFLDHSRTSFNIRLRFLSECRRGIDLLRLNVYGHLSDKYVYKRKKALMHFALTSILLLTRRYYVCALFNLHWVTLVQRLFCLIQRPTAIWIIDFSNNHHHQHYHHDQRQQQQQQQKQQQQQQQPIPECQNTPFEGNYVK